jgi:hypothetical protein
MSLLFVRSVGPIKTSRVKGYRGNIGDYHYKENWDRIAHWKNIRHAGKDFDVTGTLFLDSTLAPKPGLALHTPMIVQPHELSDNRHETRIEENTGTCGRYMRLGRNRHTDCFLI